MDNTSGEEDRAIRAASAFGGLADDLIKIIERLDKLLTERSAELETAKSSISELEGESKSLTAENTELRAFNDEWVAERNRVANT